MSLLAKCLLGVAIATAAIGVLFLPLALGLMAGFPFSLWTDEKLEQVGARATFEESVDCLVRYRYYSAERDLGVRLGSEEVAFCFPPQTPVTRKALIACFDRYERSHPGHVGWPEDNMQGCTWDGLVTAANPTGLAFGDVAAVPAVPRAGKRFVLTVGVTGSGDVNEAIMKDALATYVTIDDIPLSHIQGADADGSFYLEFTVPKTAGGKRVTITLTLAAHTPTGEKVVTFTVGR